MHNIANIINFYSRNKPKNIIKIGGNCTNKMHNIYLDNCIYICGNCNNFVCNECINFNKNICINCTVGSKQNNTQWGYFCGVCSHYNTARVCKNCGKLIIFWTCYRYCHNKIGIGEKNTWGGNIFCNDCYSNLKLQSE